MNIRLFQIGWNYSQDGPGNRLIYHFQGCNFDCPWCSNPEGRSLQGSFFVKEDLLVPEVCPHGMIRDGKLIDRAYCKECEGKECIHIYRNQGISYTATEYTIEDLVKKAVDARPLFYDGGGVTISGGEATLQFPQLKKLLEKLKQKGIHTALETNGSHPRLCELLPFIDLLIFDLKHWDFTIAHPVIQNNGASVLQNLQQCAASGQQMLARITLIPGFNTSEEDIAKFAQLFIPLTQLGTVKLELLFYHDYGRHKWEAIGEEYGGPEKSMSKEDMNTYTQQFTSHGLTIITT